MILVLTDRHVRPSLARAIARVHLLKRGAARGRAALARKPALREVGHPDRHTISDTAVDRTGPRQEWDEAQDTAARPHPSVADRARDRAVARPRDRVRMTRKTRRRLAR